MEETLPPPLSASSCRPQRDTIQGMNSLILARRPNQPFTQEEIGAAAGCSHQNVSLIINQALGKLREKLSTKEIDETGEVRDGAQGFRDFLMEIEGQSQCDIL